MTSSEFAEHIKKLGITTASPEAMRQSMPNPDGEPRHIRGPKFRPLFGRILTPKFKKDIEEMRTYDMDVRPILLDGKGVDQ